MTRSRLLALPLVVLLSSCDNFREHVTIEPWESSVITVPPAPSLPGHEAPIEMTPVGPGSGAEVKAGDLVHLRFTRSSTWDDNSVRNDAPETVWLWTGREPDPGMGLWGKFGSPELRTALIGHKVGDVFELRVSTKGRDVSAPVYGIAGPDSPRTGFNQFIGQYAVADQKTLASGGSAGDHPSWSTIEILAACPAKFATRRGRMTQWGYVASTTSPKVFQTDRSGDLKWSAIEAHCPADGDVRFMLGPIYWTEKPVVPGMLMAWESTYRSARPKQKFPEDYAFVTINGRTLPNKP